MPAAESLGSTAGVERCVLEDVDGGSTHSAPDAETAAGAGGSVIQVAMAELDHTTDGGGFAPAAEGAMGGGTLGIPEISVDEGEGKAPVTVSVEDGMSTPVVEVLQDRVAALQDDRDDGHTSASPFLRGGSTDTRRLSSARRMIR